MKTILSITVVLLLAVQAWAQDVSVTGKVTAAEDGINLPGVSVVVKGTSTGTTTNPEGTYRLSVPPNATLVFSYVGYMPQEVTVQNRSTINVSLSADVRSLQEVVVVAYGQQTRRALTGAVSAVNADQIRAQQVVSPVQALQGTAPGVLVVNGSGQPGDNPAIRIRGVGSINASSNPLIVVDGIPFQGNINSINPGDIDNISVLKDASAAALYGSRAANGVILITTKMGRKGTTEISVYSSYGVSSRAVKEYSFLNTQQQFELGWEAIRNLAQDAGIPQPEQFASENLVSEFRYNPYGIAQPVGADGKLVSGANLLWNTDWTKELTNRNAARKEVGVSVGGGNDKTRYFLSTAYLGQEGYLITSKFERISARMNLTSDLKDWLQVGLRTQFVYADQNAPTQGGSSFDNVVQYTRSMSSIYPVYERDDKGNLVLDANGQPIYDFGNPNPDRQVNQDRPVLTPSNLVATTYLNDARRERFTTSLNGFAEVRPLPGLRLRSNFGIDRYSYSLLDYENPRQGNGANVGGRVTRQNDLTTSWTWNNMVNYTKAFGPHSIDLMGSIEAYNFLYETMSSQKIGFPFFGLKELSSGAQTEFANGYTNRERIVSYLGRAVYSYRDKLFLEATVRRDGSSRFSPEGGRRWGFFPSVGASWVLSEEAFVKPITSLSFLKLRASFGTLGNNGLLTQAGGILADNYFPYLSLFSTGYNDLTNSGVYFTYLANPQISWEKQASLNVGVDFGFLQDRIRGNLDYYVKNTYDLLFGRPLVPSSGIPSVDENIGDLRNSGIELAVNTVNIRGKNLTWETGINFTTVKNRLTSLPQGVIKSGEFQREVGKSVYEFHIPLYAGVDPQDGSAMWYQDVLDASGNPTGERTTTKVQGDATDYYQGTAIPKWLGGFTSKLTYRGFDLSLLLNFAGGNKIIDYDYTGLMHGFTAVGYQLHTDMLNRWQKPGDVTGVPRLDPTNTDIVQRSSNYLFKGDYVRLRNVTLGYNVKVPARFVRNFRVYVQADNYWTWVPGAKKGLDPETTNANNLPNGTTSNTSSIFKTLTGGINLTF
ncbi:SusC/RagA family TonB-linked outer membrane protein [Larkinella soli]|uniref:SusC/RagA family TonB-linked outer membrane protein n=1 Tax=Larkinella soli TaxID=1770527 RepID=UPI000FFB1A88|nr:TonB-dependent receptor [Larkinella soli]